LDTLQTLPTGAWFELDDLLERVQDQDEDFLFADRSVVADYRRSWYHSYSTTYYYGSTKELLAKFEKFELSYVQSLVPGFLHQLGVVDLGYMKGKWGAFRLTPLGQALLAAGDGQAPAELAGMDTGKLVLQPNFQVVAIGPVNLAWLARLDLFADRERADRGAFQYRISRDSVYRAQQLGMDVVQVLHFLEGTAGVELPQNVRRSLEEWGAHHERIVFRSGVSLLQAADAALLAGLMADDHLGAHLARSLSPQVALLTKDAETPLIAALVEQGRFPAVSGAQPEASDGSVIVEEDGTIRPVHAVSSLHLRGRLARLAEEGAGGQWKLTEKSVRRAGGSRRKVTRLLAELRKLHRRRLPPVVVERIKAWGGYYGDASAGSITLLEFRDPQSLEELRKDPDLAPVLSPFLADKRALAVVPSDKLSEIKELLARFGIHVRDGLKT
jgi:hypothetical protein